MIRTATGAGSRSGRPILWLPPLLALIHILPAFSAGTGARMDGRALWLLRCAGVGAVLLGWAFRWVSLQPWTEASVRWMLRLLLACGGLAIAVGGVTGSLRLHLVMVFVAITVSLVGILYPDEEPARVPADR